MNTAAKHKMWDNANKIGRLEKGAIRVFKPVISFLKSQLALTMYCFVLLLTAAWMEQHI